MRIELGTLLGDGIGPDIVRATMQVMLHAVRRRDVDLRFVELPAGLAALEAHGSTLPDKTVDALSQLEGWILGPVTHHLYPEGDDRFRNPSGFLRKHLSLYANVRPARAFDGVPCLRPDIDLVIVRENTEGFYADRNLVEGTGEFRPDHDTVLSLRVVTRRASTRVARRAFELARSRDKQRKVTAVHKANVLKSGCGLFLECCRDVATQFPDVAFEDCHVDACALYLVTRPETFDVIVTTNMFGDILSDEAAGLVGGLGLAPGLNVGDERAMAQATHGSAPDIAHLHTANPVAEMLSGAMLLRWLADRREHAALHDAARAIEGGVAIALRDRRLRTPDLGGANDTAGFTRTVLASMDLCA
jgi:3-isopropylmalate dehydrogenase